jgi:hypothetical protein
MNKDLIIEIILLHLFILGGGIILFLILYVSTENYGHAAFDPIWLMPIYIFIFIASIVISIMKDGYCFSYLLVRLCLITSIFGFSLTIMLRKFNILQEKSDWIHSGMVPPPEWSFLFLVIFLALYLLTIYLLTLISIFKGPLRGVFS